MTTARSHRVRRLLAALLTAASISVLLGACGEKDERIDEVRRYVRATQREARAFQYSSNVFADPFSEKPARKVAVQGFVEDDFRFKAQVVDNGRPAFEEIVSDDALAVRFLDGRFLTPLLNKRLGADATLDTDIEGLSVVEALRTRRWVLDEAGAPPLTRGSQDTDSIGADPVVDALTALAYVDRALTEAIAVEKWSEDDVTPPYAESEDTFPKPEEGSGVTRYDLVRPDLPAPGSRSQTGEAAIPSTRHFRRMAIYVKDERVIRVMEQVDIRGRKLDRFRNYFKSLLRSGEASPDVIAEVDRFFDETPEDELPYRVLQFLNLGLRQFGSEGVLVRSMTLDFPSTDGVTAIELPQQEVVKGDLAVLVLSGKAKSGEDGASGATSETADTTETSTTATDGSTTSSP